MPGSVCLCKVRTPMQDAGMNARCEHRCKMAVHTPMQTAMDRNCNGCIYTIILCCVASVVKSVVSLFNGSKCNRVTFSLHLTEMRRCYSSGQNVTLLHVCYM